ncbi:MAG: hypothetical protein GTN90_05930, partial [Xanthomonadales bacterium]|nr:hypothetical protein [Xanthomonadales bacterium]
MDDPVEPVAALRRYVRVLDQDLGRRSYRRDPGQHPMDRLAQERIMGNPVRHGARGGGRLPLGPGESHQGSRPARISSDQLTRALRLDPQIGEIGHMGDLIQALEQSPFGQAVELVEAHVQR